MTFTSTSVESYIINTENKIYTINTMQEYPHNQHAESNTSLTKSIPVRTEEMYPAVQSQDHSEIIPTIEKVTPRIRQYRDGDLDSMVTLDMASFSDVYSGYERTSEEVRADLMETFAKRIELIGPQWTQILEDESTGKIIGFLMSCPTSKQPEEFTSWEDTTDNGSLDSTFDPEGKDIYVISLTTERSSLGRSYEDLLYASLMNKGISEGYRKAFFEARLPGLRKWMEGQSTADNKDIHKLSQAEKDAYAQQYFRLKKQRDGKEVPYDPLLRSFSKLGCDFVKLVPEAYQDEPSMNYGVLTVVNNPLPERIQGLKSMRTIAGRGMAYALRSKRLSNLFFQETMPTDETQEDNEPKASSRYERIVDSVDRHKTKLILGAAAISLTLTISLDPLGETKDKVIDAAPWVGGGILASEALWIGGAAMMLAAVGKTIKNPLKIRKQVPELAQKADSSKLFKAGFYINTTGAVGDFAVLSVGVMNKLPVHSWGVLGIALADLGITIAVRRAIYKGIKKNAKEQQHELLEKTS